MDDIDLARFVENFNPRPPHGGRRDSIKASLNGKGISIHALRMEGDQWQLVSG